jgi:phenylacetate-CoA ligase
MLADNASEFQPRTHRSAGTTGQPISILIDRMRHSIGWADMYRWWSVGGWRLGDKQFVVAGAALRPRQLSGYKAKLYTKLNHFEDYSSFDLTAEALDRLLKRLEKHKGPVFLRGYASSMHALARHASSVNWNGHVKAVFTTAETLFPEQRAQIESGLQGPVFDQWGCRDGGISAFECERHNGMHLAIENAVVEICRDGSPVANGISGEVVATDLFSYASPVIRYEVGDVAGYATASCSCGRGLPLIASVEGRVSGFLIGSGGRRIHGEFFSHVFWETPWVKQFQIEQDVPEEIVVKIVKVGVPSSDQLNGIRELMQGTTGDKCRIRIEFVDEIPAGPMGKRQFVICRIPTA